MRIQTIFPPKAYLIILAITAAALFLYIILAILIPTGIRWEFTEEGVGISDTIEGTGPEAQIGDTLVVHYTGTFEDGTPFDNSYRRGSPFVVRLGEGRVIQGWELGMKGMREGGTRNLLIPPEFAYGEGGVRGMVPPNTTLIFEIELLEIRR